MTSEQNAPLGVRIESAGHAAFALTMVALGVLGFLHGDFASVWQSVPEWFPAQTALAYLCALVALSTGLGLLWPRSAPAASRLLWSYLFLWLLLFKGRDILLDPLSEGPYQSAGETAAITAGAWVLYAWFADGRVKGWLANTVGDRGVRMARVLYALALVAFGLSHFVYVDLTTPLIPAYLPAPPIFWAYFTGTAFLAAGAAMLFGAWPRLAAALSALQIGLFTLLVWVPMVVAGNISDQHWTEFVMSWTITAGAWVVADSYRGKPWFGRPGARTGQNSA